MISKYVQLYVFSFHLVLLNDLPSHVVIHWTVFPLQQQLHYYNLFFLNLWALRCVKDQRKLHQDWSYFCSPSCQLIFFNNLWNNLDAFTLLISLNKLHIAFGSVYGIFASTHAFDLLCYIPLFLNNFISFIHHFFVDCKEQFELNWCIVKFRNHYTMQLLQLL